MAWAKVPVTTTDIPAHQHMDEIREAIDERDDILQMAIWGAGNSITVTNVALNDYGRYMQEYQWAIATGAGGESLIYNFAGATDNKPVASTEANDFKTFVSGAPGAGEINFNVETGATGAGTTWRKLGGLPPVGDPGDIRHPNDCRLVLNRIVRFKSLDLRDYDPFTTDGIDGYYYVSSVSFADWRSTVFANIETNPSSAAGIIQVPVLGRNSAYDPFSGEPDYQGDAQYSESCSCSFSLADDPGGTSYSGAWLILEAFSASTDDGNGVNFGTVEEFEFTVKINGTLVATITSGDAADISNFKAADGSTFDAWVIDIDPELDIDGNNTVVLTYNQTPTTDPGFAQANEPYGDCISQGDEPSLCLVVEYDHWDYHT